MSHELRVQKYLRDGGTLDGLRTLYAIKTRRHQNHPHVVCLKYDQIASPFADEIVRECRGLVLDENDNWRVLSRAYSKFFNASEGHAADIDWSTARVQEKVDGSLCVLSFYENAWHVSTTGTPDASGDVHASGRTFAGLFWETYRKYDHAAWPSDEARGHSFYFELTSPFNRVVVNHSETSLTLLGCRHLDSDRELTPAEALPLLNMPRPVPIVREYPLTSIDEIVATFPAMSPLTQEGYVVVDGNWNRIKVKSPAYLAMHRAVGGLSRKAFVEIARTGETSEVIAVFPELRAQLDKVKADVDALVSEVESDYARHKDIAIQKDFAMAVKSTRCPAALFCVRSKKADSVRAYFRDVPIASLMDLLGYRGGDEPLVKEAA